MNNSEFINWFGDITKSYDNQSSWSDEDELDSLWKEYNDFVQELKNDGYKIMRNSSGKHKIVKVDN